MGNVLKGGNVNVKFYQNELPAQPCGLTFMEICEFWYRDYEKLAKDKSYIYWLFPNETCGKSQYASPLSKKEIEIFKTDEVILERFLRSFELMLDYFGMRRSGMTFFLNENADERLDHLRNNPGDYIMITRILRSLRLFGLEDIRESWLHFLLVLINDGKLPNARASYNEYWMHN